ncbi:hypothetical protein A3C89_01640 [Candidatus Kaiserbacteria bacterium RIFCSPHIGHO2_02_FULL_50_50]|uniref:Uncharacterized protein n=1 Tax=Candidatus Kaiserbacteria bacterium RIFCSPHIGHO2_02_FULL_50_50 TaxID=1798492 RepID=A0A1F6DDI1_9BACT|nr:MAG: hypothetical protein A3C89_01640 [Candidatus Kaiserbacteria bacterium RIFCSPHIGHO2_02_FULL_50_50]OGG88156.1 MAG: hypothetical protein A3G62_02675 [Candidatus Kaiserbacteria bacterium RIFCSPLOWO2_12_FULL_50_10]
MTATLVTHQVVDGSAATRPVASILMRVVEARGETFRTKVIFLDPEDGPICWRVQLYRPFSLLSFRKKEVFAQIHVDSDPVRFALTVFNSLLSNDETQKIKDGIAVLERQFKGQRLIA